ncbi:MAG: CAP domain-containing protein [Pacificimonas sp.]
MPTQCGSEAGRTERAFRLINALREKHGVKAVILDRDLVKAGNRHLTDIERSGRFGHVGSDGRYFEHRVRDLDFEGMPRAENLAWNQTTATEAVQNWMLSPPHRRAMLLADVTHIGVSYRCSPRHGHLWSMIVGRAPRAAP